MSRTEIELIRDGKVVRADLVNGIIDTSKLDTDAVTTIKIKDKQITTAKLADSVGNFFFPIGGIIMWSGGAATIPPNFRLCDGQNGTPDLRGRFIVGAGGPYTPGDTGGFNQVTLTEAQLATHNHGDGTYGTDANEHAHGTGTLVMDTNSHQHPAGDYGTSEHNHKHNYSYASAGGSGSELEQEGRPDGARLQGRTGETSPIDHSHTVTGNSGLNEHAHQISGSTANHTHSHDITGVSGDSGSSQPHENRPPYYALAYIMKVS